MKIKHPVPIIVTVIVAIVIGVSYLILPLIFPSKIQTMPQQPQPAVSAVVFIEDAQSDESENHGIYPNLITVVIGVNNTVRWVNQDTIPHGAPIPDDDSIDPDFAKTEARIYNENGGKESFIMPGHSYQYTFTHPARIDYHMVPHPQMKGTIIVLG